MAIGVQYWGTSVRRMAVPGSYSAGSGSFMKKPRMSAAFFYYTCIAGILLIGSAASRKLRVDFQRQIRPILSIIACGATDLTSRPRWRACAWTPRTGSSLSARTGFQLFGEAQESLSTDEFRSGSEGGECHLWWPHKELTDETKALLRQWIEEGAEWKQHWAFTPPARPDLPVVKNDKWARNPIDPLRFWQNWSECSTAIYRRRIKGS